jgi:hypothetical protein
VQKLTARVLQSLSAELDKLYTATKRGLIALDYFLRVLLPQVFYFAHSERQLAGPDQTITCHFTDCPSGHGRCRMKPGSLLKNRDVLADKPAVELPAFCFMFSRLTLVNPQHQSR